MQDERMKRDPKHVLIGMAIGNGSTRWETSMSLIRLCTEKNVLGLSFSIVPGGGCDVAHGRNLITHHCLTRTDAGKLVFIDSDVRFEPKDLMRLCTLNQDLPIISGIYPRKGKTLRWSYNGVRRETETGLWEVDELCTGFLGIDVEEVLLPMVAAYPETEYVIEDAEYRSELGHELFAMGVVNRRRLSEDYYFSLRAKELGHRLLIDPDIQLGHIGNIDFLDLFQGHPEVVAKKTASSHA